MIFGLKCFVIQSKKMELMKGRDLYKMSSAWSVSSIFTFLILTSILKKENKKLSIKIYHFITWDDLA